MKFQDSYYSCNCGLEVLVLRQYDKEPQVELSMYSMNPLKMRFWDKIKFAYNLIFKNQYYTDQIILDFKETNRLRDNLTWAIASMDVNNG